MRAPNGQTIDVASEESSEGRWIPLSVCVGDIPSAALAMMPPTMFVLRELAEVVQAGGSLGAAIEQTATRTPRTVVPKLVVEGTQSMVVFPWDPEYTTLPGEGVDWDDIARSERSHWPSRLTARPPRV